MNHLIKHTTIAAAVAIGGMAAAHDARAQADPLSLTSIHFYETANVKDDEFETVATITTEAGWKPEAHWLMGPRNDYFLRAFIDKKTGLTRFQVYSTIRYAADTWRRYATANYLTATAPESVPTDRIGTGGVDCGSRTLGCVFTEVLGFNVPAQKLREIAQTYNSEKRENWRYKLKAISGDEYLAELPLAEIVGLLARVDRHLADKGLRSNN